MLKPKFVGMQVQYLDHMGSDVNVVNAARCSFAKEVSEFDPKKDTGLINYLCKHNHWSPLAHTSVSIRVKAPIFMARQFVKHQVGLVWNEESRRYIDDTPEFYLPEVWRSRPQNVKQGSGDASVEYLRWNDAAGDQDPRNCTENVVDACLYLYNNMLESGIAPEQARMVLPQNTMTNWIWTGSIMAFARVCKLRLDSHAQVEAQELAQMIEDTVAPLYPVSWKALMKHLKV
ncbi:MAG: putative flavin-dependent thymidylate synthase [Prokaryotic dsDNA virus sp.]|nr:MAG: putative flavin-dependent thymidylate synthase [Prokaryotic dsDNA virus sp.]